MAIQRIRVWRTYDTVSGGSGESSRESAERRLANPVGPHYRVMQTAVRTIDTDTGAQACSEWTRVVASGAIVRCDCPASEEEPFYFEHKEWCATRGRPF